VVFLLFIICGVDESIVKVTQGGVINIMRWRIINVCVKHHRSISQPKGHKSIVELTIAGLEWSLELVVFIDSDEVVGVPEV